MKSGSQRRESTCGMVSQRRHLWLSSISLFACLAGAVAFTLPEASFAELDPTIRIRVNNYSNASQAAITQAEQQAEPILAKAGLRTHWLDCQAQSLANIPDGACEAALQAGEVVLRVIAEPNRNVFTDDVFGFAVVPILATVYYEPARRYARSDNSEFEASIILGCAIAHELGHLFLRGQGHSSVGIMRPKWSHAQIQQALQGCLSFTAEQALELKSAARARPKEVRATLVVPEANLVGHP